MTTVYLPAEHRELVDRLARSETGKGGKPVLPTYMHVMVLAAMVGHAKSMARSVDNRGPEVYDNVFANHGCDGLAYLLALQSEGNGDILRDTRESDCWRVIQDYAAAGLDEIDGWLKDAPSDVDGVNTILARMKESAAALVAEDSERLNPDLGI